MTDRQEGRVAVHLNRHEDWDALRGRGELLRRAARLALDSGGERRRGEISVTCLPAEQIARINREYLGREGPTDVIAFDLGGDAELLGDVYVCPDVAADAARAEGIALPEEVTRLVVHGVLHVLGHEHPEDGDRWASPMFRLQERLVERALAGDGA